MLLPLYTSAGQGIPLWNSNKEEYVSVFDSRATDARFRGRQQLVQQGPHKPVWAQRDSAQILINERSVARLTYLVARPYNTPALRAGWVERASLGHLFKLLHRYSIKYPMEKQRLSPHECSCGDNSLKAIEDEENARSRFRRPTSREDRNGGSGTNGDGHMGRNGHRKNDYGLQDDEKASDDDKKASNDNEEKANSPKNLSAPPKSTLSSVLGFVTNPVSGIWPGGSRHEEDSSPQPLSKEQDTSTDAEVEKAWMYDFSMLEQGDINYDLERKTKMWADPWVVRGVCRAPLQERDFKKIARGEPLDTEGYISPPNASRYDDFALGFLPGPGRHWTDDAEPFYTSLDPLDKVKRESMADRKDERDSTKMALAGPSGSKGPLSSSPPSPLSTAASSLLAARWEQRFKMLQVSATKALQTSALVSVEAAEQNKRDARVCSLEFLEKMHGMAGFVTEHPAEFVSFLSGSW